VLPSLVLYLRILALDPREAVALAARLEHEDPETLMRLCVIESGGCRRVGVHSQARPGVARRPGLGAWVKAVSAGRLHPSEECPQHQQSDDPERWGVRGPFGLVAAFHLHHIAHCAAPESLDVPFLAAVAGARHLRQLRRMVPAARVMEAWRVGVGRVRRGRISA
jgi:hypothetical protein